MKNRLVLFLFIPFICILFLLLLRYDLSHAEDSPIDKKFECIKKFNFDGINLSSHEWESYNNLLKNYFLCKALTTRNIKQCDRLIYEPAYGDCIQTYKMYMFFTELVQKGSVSQDVRSGHVIGEKYYQGFVGSFKNKDDSVCASTEEPQNCKALINLDERMAVDWRTSNQIIFMKALKNSDANLCYKLANDPRGIDIVEACKAMVTGNMGICEQCQGVSDFKEAYCDYQSRKGGS